MVKGRDRFVFPLGTEKTLEPIFRTVWSFGKCVRACQRYISFLLISKLRGCLAGRLWDACPRWVGPLDSGVRPDKQPFGRSSPSYAAHSFYLENVSINLNPNQGALWCLQGDQIAICTPPARTASAILPAPSMQIVGRLPTRRVTRKRPTSSGAFSKPSTPTQRRFPSLVTRNRCLRAPQEPPRACLIGRAPASTSVVQPTMAGFNAVNQATRRAN